MAESTRQIPLDEPPSRSSGLAVASLVLGILSFAVASLALDILPFASAGLFCSIPGIITGHMDRSRIRQAPNFGDAAMALAGLILSYLNILAVIAVIVVSNQIRSELPTNDSAARGGLRTISIGEAAFQLEGINPLPNGIGQYGTLEELGAGERPFIDAALASGTKQGYVFTITPALVDGVPVYTATAVPKEMGVTGDQTFFVDHTGVIRFESDGSVATSTSPPMN